MTETIPAAFDMLTADNSCALLIDHQPGLFLNASDITLLALRNNAIALAKVLRLHKIPTVISCAAPGPAGPMGPLLPEIAEQFAKVEPIYRTKINSWQDPRIRGAIEATGRKKVICAGITGDFCIGLPAKNMAAEGYDVRLVMDASGNDSRIILQAAIANLRTSPSTGSKSKGGSESPASSRKTGRARTRPKACSKSTGSTTRPGPFSRQSRKATRRSSRRRDDVRGPSNSTHATTRH